MGLRKTKRSAINDSKCVLMSQQKESLLLDDMHGADHANCLAGVIPDYVAVVIDRNIRTIGFPEAVRGHPVFRSTGFKGARHAGIHLCPVFGMDTLGP